MEQKRGFSLTTRRRQFDVALRSVKLRSVSSTAAAKDKSILPIIPMDRRPDTGGHANFNSHFRTRGRLVS
jgi:hypothetical protein